MMYSDNVGMLCNHMDGGGAGDTREGDRRNVPVIITKTLELRHVEGTRGRRTHDGLPPTTTNAPGGGGGGGSKESCRET